MLERALGAVAADTGEDVPNEDIVNAYALDKETFIEVSKEELRYRGTWAARRDGCHALSLGRKRQSGPIPLSPMGRMNAQSRIRSGLYPAT
jgi:hypothetical protein